MLKLLVRDALSVMRWGLHRLLRRPVRSGVRILLYHAIATLPRRRDRWRLSVPPALLAAHVAWLRRHGYAIVSLEDALDMIRGTRPMIEKAVAVTFDDGFRDVLTQAYPILRQAQVPATVFVVPGCLGSPEPFPWVEPSVGFARPLQWEELQTLLGDQLVSIGSHTWSHRTLSRLPVEEQGLELARSKSALEARLGTSVKWLAYPYGHAGSFSQETIACVQRVGFEAAFANIMGVNRAGDSLWMVRRTRVGWDDRLWRFHLKMAGAYDWLDR